MALFGPTSGQSMIAPINQMTQAAIAARTGGATLPSIMQAMAAPPEAMAKTLAPGAPYNPVPPQVEQLIAQGMSPIAAGAPEWYTPAGTTYQGNNLFGTTGQVSYAVPAMGAGQYGGAAFIPTPEGQAGYNELQAAFPGYTQLDSRFLTNGQLNTPGPGGDTTRQYIADPSAVKYDPKFGYIAPASLFGQAGTKGKTWLESGGYGILAPLAFGALGLSGALGPGVASGGGTPAALAAAADPIEAGWLAMNATGAPGFTSAANALGYGTFEGLASALNPAWVSGGSVLGADPIEAGWNAMQQTGADTFTGAANQLGYPTFESFAGSINPSWVNPGFAGSSGADLLGGGQGAEAFAPTPNGFGTGGWGTFDYFGLPSSGSMLSPEVLGSMASAADAYVPGTAAFNATMGGGIGAGLPASTSTLGGVGSLAGGTALMSPFGSLGPAPTMPSFSPASVGGSGSFYNDILGTLTNKLDDPFRWLQLASSLGLTLAGQDAIRSAANKAAATADPYAPFRSGNAAAFNAGQQAGPGANPVTELLSNPTEVLRNTPGYQFGLDQGLEAINRKAAATGNLGSGNLLLELLKYGQGYADQNYGAEFDRRRGLWQDALNQYNANQNRLGAAAGAFQSPATAAQIQAQGDTARQQTLYGGINDVLSRIFTPNVMDPRIQQSIVDDLMRRAYNR